jgi:anti-sigma regulatory factor (Ser/Thr protein kinase)
MRRVSFSTLLDVDLYETERLNQMVRQFGMWHGLPEDAVFVVGLSLDELVTNIVVHAGSRDPQAKQIKLSMKLNKQEVLVEIEDDGCEFNPLELPSPDLDAPLQNREPGGLGIHLARSFMDGICYKRIGCCNRLTLTKRICCTA